MVPEVVERIYQLKERGFLIGLLTNNIAEAWPTVNDGLPIDDLFDVVINSAFVGMRKPEHRIYVHALEKLGVRAEHAVFLDDNRVNLEAARACGLNVVEVKQPIAALEKLEAVIKELAR